MGGLPHRVSSLIRFRRMRMSASSLLREKIMTRPACVLHYCVCLPSVILLPALWSASPARSRVCAHSVELWVRVIEKTLLGLVPLLPNCSSCVHGFSLPCWGLHNHIVSPSENSLNHLLDGRMLSSSWRCNSIEALSPISLHTSVNLLMSESFDSICEKSKRITFSCTFSVV